MKEGDLVEVTPNTGNDKTTLTGLIVKITVVGANSVGNKYARLYDVLISDMDQVLTISPIFFNMRKLDD